MIDDIYEPLSLYRDRFKSEHAKNTAAFFEALVEASGVDEKVNAETVTAIRSLEGQISAGSSSCSNWKMLRILVVLVLVGGVVVAGLFLGHLASPASISADPGILWFLVGIVSSAAAGFFLKKKINPLIRALTERIANLKESHGARMGEAWEQMASLNNRYDWGMFAKITQQTVPRLVLDPFFSLARLYELRDCFGWEDGFNADKSVIFAQSGEINGNPFVLAETLDFEWGEKTYHGSLTISWQELETYTDSNGKLRSRTVTRTQVLQATVTKPAPVYTRRKFVIYGNEAAPDLRFSRSPSGLSKSDGGFFDKMLLKSEIKKLEKLSRNLDDDSSFTIMSNHEFDALFHSIDRDHEIQYRVLFTPLAQEQMVALLKDKTVGFGDDFRFVKSRMINFIQPAHLSDINISDAPDRLKNYDLADARRAFNAFGNDYFRHLYFSLAPLLVIPVYQQHRSHQNIYNAAYGRTACFWEHEAIANFHGQEAFRHPQSITQDILKTRPDNAGNIDVTAHGFRGEERIDYVSMLGGDGRWHNVPVHWTEYLPVQNTTQLAIRETEGGSRLEFEQQAQTSSEWRSFINDSRAEADQVVFRRSIASVLRKRA